MNIKKTIFKPAKHSNASGPHKTILNLLRSVYAGFTIMENQTIQVEVRGRTSSLEVDLVVKELRVAIEVNGEQHYKFNTFFHKSPADFEAQKNRDVCKAQAVVDAGYTLVTIRDTDIDRLTPDKLAKLINKAIQASV